jgi:hypothetical protein
MEEKAMLLVAMLLAGLALIGSLSPMPFAHATTGPSTRLTVESTDAEIVAGTSGTVRALFSVIVAGGALLSGDPLIDCPLDTLDRCGDTQDVAGEVEVCVDYRTIDGTATAGADYIPVHGTLRMTVSPGLGAEPGGGGIAVQLIGDLQSNQGETFSVIIAPSAICSTPTTMSDPEGQATLVPPAPPAPVSASLRIGTFNAQFLPPVAANKGGCEAIPNRATLIAERLKSSGDEVIVLQEMIDENARGDMLRALRPTSRHSIAKVDCKLSQD